MLSDTLKFKIFDCHGFVDQNLQYYFSFFLLIFLSLSLLSSFLCPRLHCFCCDSDVVLCMFWCFFSVVCLVVSCVCVVWSISSMRRSFCRGDRGMARDVHRNTYNILHFCVPVVCLFSVCCGIGCVLPCDCLVCTCVCSCLCSYAPTLSLLFFSLLFQTTDCFSDGLFSPLILVFFQLPLNL